MDFPFGECVNMLFMFVLGVSAHLVFESAKNVSCGRIEMLNMVGAAS